MKRQHPAVRAPKASQREREQRQATIDTLISRALRGVLTIPEAAVLADYWRAERRAADLTRRRLTDTTRALQKHREAADAEVRRLEAELAELRAAAPPEATSAPLAASQSAHGARVVRPAPDAADGRTAAAA